MVKKKKKFKHLKFLNKSVSFKNKKLIIDLGKGKIKDFPKQVYLVSKKYDGVLCAFRNGRMLSSSLKDLPNTRLREHFKELIKFSKEKNITLIGELYQHNLTFQEIISIVMSHDKEVPEEFKLFCFDAIKNDNYDEEFINRLDYIPKIKKLYKVKHLGINTKYPEELEEEYIKNLDKGFEGLILKNPHGKYKCGRTTFNENIGFKMKPYLTSDMMILSVIQATKVREGAEKKINELGRSVTSKKKDDRVLIDKASAFKVRFKDKIFRVTIAEKDPVKKRIWENRDRYLGEFVEVKYMMVGAKNGIPRHPRTLRMRWKKLDE